MGFRLFTPVVMVWDEDPTIAADKLALVKREIDGLGFVAKAESFNALEAWLSSLPGQNWRNVRRPIVSSLNLTHMLPLSAVWSGEVRNRHLDASALLVAETQGATPFYLNLHTGDVGHTMIVGPTGAGKSTLLALIAAQFFRCKDARIVMFDKGRSARANTHAVGGQYFELGDPASMSLQPFATIDCAEEMAFAQEWLLDIARREGVNLSPKTKDERWSAPALPPRSCSIRSRSFRLS